MTNYRNNDLRSVSRLFYALSDETRVRFLFALRHGELCVCQLIALTDLAPSTVSKHLSILRDSGVIDARKVGRWVYYRITEQSDFPVTGKQASPIFQSLENSPEIQADDKKLKRICREDINVLCRKLAGRS